MPALKTCSSRISPPPPLTRAGGVGLPGIPAPSCCLGSLAVMLGNRSQLWGIPVRVVAAHWSACHFDWFLMGLGAMAHVAHGAVVFVLLPRILWVAAAAVAAGVDEFQFGTTRAQSLAEHLHILDNDELGLDDRHWECEALHLQRLCAKYMGLMCSTADGLTKAEQHLEPYLELSDPQADALQTALFHIKDVRGQLQQQHTELQVKAPYALQHSADAECQTDAQRCVPDVPSPDRPMFLCDPDCCFIVYETLPFADDAPDVSCAEEPPRSLLQEPTEGPSVRWVGVDGCTTPDETSAVEVTNRLPQEQAPNQQQELEHAPHVSWAEAAGSAIAEENSALRVATKRLEEQVEMLQREVQLLRAESRGTAADTSPWVAPPPSDPVATVMDETGAVSPRVSTEPERAVAMQATVAERLDSMSQELQTSEEMCRGLEAENGQLSAQVASLQRDLESFAQDRERAGKEAAAPLERSPAKPREVREVPVTLDPVGQGELLSGTVSESDGPTVCSLEREMEQLRQEMNAQRSQASLQIIQLRQEYEKKIDSFAMAQRQVEKREAETKVWPRALVLGPRVISRAFAHSLRPSGSKHECGLGGIAPHPLAGGPWGGNERESGCGGSKGGREGGEWGEGGEGGTAKRGGNAPARGNYIFCLR